MTDSCADAMSRLARLLAILLILAPAGLAAREPRPLLPDGTLIEEPARPLPDDEVPDDTGVEETSDGDAGAAPPAAGDSDPGQTGIQVDPLLAIPVDDIGTLTPETGGFAADLWSGLSRPDLLALLDLVPGPSGFHVLNELRRRLLLTAAQAPAGEAGDEGPVLRARADALFRSGDLDALSALLDRLPPDHDRKDLHQLAVTTRLLVRDPSGTARRRACSDAGHWLARSLDPFWQKAKIACETAAGNWSSVDYATRILIELGHEEDRFLLLADAALQQLDEPVDLAAGDLDGIDGAMLVLGRLVLADPDTGHLPAWILAGYQLSRPPLPETWRLAVARRAEHAGLMPTEDLVEAYLAPPASDRPSREEEPGTEAQGQGGGGDEERRSIELVLAMLSHESPVARAQATSQVLERARARGTVAAVGRLHTLQLPIRPDPALGWFAADAALLQVASGDARGARPWLALAERESTASAVGEARWHRIWPAIRIATGDEVLAWSTPRLEAWMERADTPEGRLRAARLLVLLEVFGDQVPSTAWRDLAQVTAETGAGPAVPRALAAALEAGRFGEALALVLVLAGSGEPGTRSTGDLVAAVAALRALGLEDEARRLAFDIAIAGP
ncbi:MAG: hypothetical protein OXE86_07895 [Alphaproteobacteria bacterium]|nr:hypothetical protein [Alphaproteobacteria bacterium]